MKPRTNAFHGSVYEYLRHDALDARTYFAKSKTEAAIQPVRRDFRRPLQKNKTWFFGNYEGRRQNTASANVLNVPTALEATGDFSDQSTPILDPGTGQPFALNKIPTVSDTKKNSELLAEEHTLDADVFYRKAIRHVDQLKDLDIALDSPTIEVAGIIIGAVLDNYFSMK